jgi:transcriptional regulator with XRE-family HTH domain
MPRKLISDVASRKRIAALRAKGLTLSQIGNLLGVTKQAIQRVLNLDALPKRIRCRECESEINPAGAMPRDDRQVLCLPCLESSSGASFGEHLQAYRLAAGLRVAALAKLAGVNPCYISLYEEGRVESAAWSIQRRLFQALGVELVMRPTLGVPDRIKLLQSRVSGVAPSNRKQLA